MLVVVNKGDERLRKDWPFLIFESGISHLVSSYYVMLVKVWLPGEQKPKPHASDSEMLFIAVGFIERSCRCHDQVLSQSTAC